MSRHTVNLQTLFSGSVLQPAKQHGGQQEAQSNFSEALQEAALTRE